jgi:hypothetical protein
MGRSPVPLARIVCLAWVCAFIAAARAGPPGVPPLLNVALVKMAADQQRWAWTWTSVYTFVRDHPERPDVFRFDPSLPYADRSRPLLLKGGPPTAEALENFRRIREKQDHDISAPEESPETAAPYPVHMALDYNLMNQQAVAYYDQASVASEDSQAVEFDVPLHSDHAIPFEVWTHFHLLLRINKDQHNLERLAILQRKSVWFAKVHQFVIEANYQTLDPKFGAVPIKMHAAMDLTVLFKKYYFGQDCTWTDYRRVVPWDSRFKVHIGPLRNLGF